MGVLIKRYANRKLYNTATSRYITLKGIAELIETGEEVSVIDNETGEDITNVALSQILVDHERSNSTASRTMLSELMTRGGDALYGALRRGVGDASDGIGELQNNLRRIVKDREQDASKLGEWIAVATPDFERIVHSAMERVFKALDLPRRGDIEALNENLQRVADAVESIQQAGPRKRGANGKTGGKSEGEPGEESTHSSGRKAGGEFQDEPDDPFDDQSDNQSDNNFDDEADDETR
jgi:polyhydroxyalkanoate synthesis repressor PhaR